MDELAHLVDTAGGQVVARVVQRKQKPDPAHYVGEGKAREIEIMRLVGATNGFVRLPFLIEGFLKGLLGGLLAVVLTWAAHSAVSRTLVETAFFGIDQLALGVLAGALLGLLGSFVSVGRHLRAVWRDA